LNLTGLNATSTWPPLAPTSGYPLPTAAGAGSSGIIVDNVAASNTVTTLNASGVATTLGLSTTIGLSTAMNSTLVTAYSSCGSPCSILTVTTNTGKKFDIDDYVTVSNTSAPLNAETVKITAIGNSTLTITPSLTLSHTSGATVTLVTNNLSTNIRVTDTTGFAASDTIQIDGEWITLSSSSSNITTCST